MKNLICLFVFAFLFACSDDDKNNSGPSIIGTWQLTAQKFGNVNGEGQWTLIEDGYIYNFTEEGVLISDRFSCNGTYTYPSNDNILLNFECISFEEGYDFSFENGFLILSPNPIVCDEGCIFKFKKTM